MREPCPVASRVALHSFLASERLLEVVPVSHVAAVAVVRWITGAASWISARRAATIDPATTLRGE